jgi:hypothetical protein
VSWTRTRATARYLNLVWNYHNKWKYLACVPFPRWDGGANDADEIRKLCLFAGTTSSCFFGFCHCILGSLLFCFNLCGLSIIDQFQYNIISTLLELLEQLCYNPKSGAECSVFPPNRRMVDRTTAHYCCGLRNVHRGPG